MQAACVKPFFTRSRFARHGGSAFGNQAIANPNDSAVIVACRAVALATAEAIHLSPRIAMNDFASRIVARRKSISSWCGLDR